MALVDLMVARLHCRADAIDDDVLAIYLGAAERHAVDFLNRSVFATQEELDIAVAAQTAGDAPIVINDAIKSAILLLCGHWYMNREDVVTGVGVAKVPLGAYELLRPHRKFAGVCS